MPRLGGQAGLCCGKVLLRLRFRLRSPSCTLLGRLIERLIELWIASLGLGASLWELSPAAGDLSGSRRVWCVQTALPSGLVHASGRLLVFIALSQGRLLLHSRFLATSGTLLCRSCDRGPILRACGVNLQSLLASLGVINARSLPCISRRRLSSNSTSATDSSLTRSSTSSCSLRSEGS